MSDDKKSGPEEGIDGVVEGVKAMAKEAVGTMLGKTALPERVRPSRTRPKPSATSPSGKARPKRRGAVTRPRRRASNPTRTKLASTTGPVEQTGPCCLLRVRHGQPNNGNAACGKGHSFRAECCPRPRDTYVRRNHHPRHVPGRDRARPRA